MTWRHQQDNWIYIWITLHLVQPVVTTSQHNFTSIGQLNFDTQCKSLSFHDLNSQTAPPLLHNTILRIAFRDWNSKTAPLTSHNNSEIVILWLKFPNCSAHLAWYTSETCFSDYNSPLSQCYCYGKLFDSFVSSRHEFILFLFVDIRGQMGATFCLHPMPYGVFRILRVKN